MKKRLKANTQRSKLPTVLKTTPQKERRRQHRNKYHYKQAHAKRERLRVKAFNQAIIHLRNSIPFFSLHKRNSKIEVLKLAVFYISFLQDLLNKHI